MVRVTLVYPSIGGRVRAAQMQPLSIAALAGLTPHDVALRFYDDRFEAVNYDAPADLAGDLAGACGRNRRSFYHPTNILRRVTLPANRRRLAESLALNFLVRKEMLEKQGFPLGQADS